MGATQSNREEVTSRCLLLGSLLVVLGLCTPHTALGKSLYLIADINSAPTPISAYDIQPPPAYVVFQTTNPVPHRASGAVGLAIDSDTASLFVTYEGGNVIELINATTMEPMGSAEAPSAQNLAGIVYDRTAKRVYAVDRNKDKLYVYAWYPLSRNLTLLSLQNLSGVVAAHGLAIDELRNLVYVGDSVPTNNVHAFRTSDWSLAANYTLSQPVQGIAVDPRRGVIYAGHSYRPYGGRGLLVKLDLKTLAETNVSIGSLTNHTSDNVVGLAVDADSGLLYITTGDQGSAQGVSGGLAVLSPDLVLLQLVPYIGHPTGIAIPTGEISYNPLGLSVDDGIAEGKGVPPGGKITYTISFDNSLNDFAVDNVVVTSTLAPETKFIEASDAGTYDSSAHRVTWRIGTLNVREARRSMKLVVRVESGTEKGFAVANAVTISSDQTPPTTQYAYTNVTGGLPLGLGGETAKNVATAGAVVVVAYSVGSFASLGVSKAFLIPKGVEASTSLMVNSVVKYGILIVGGLVALSATGVETAPAVVGTAAVGVSLAFGGRDLIANMASGLVLLIDRPLKVGDIVEVQGATGEVIDVGLRASTINTLDNVIVIIPNYLIILGPVTNYTKYDPKIRLRIPVRAALGSEVEKMREILLSVAREHPEVLKEPAPEVRIIGYGQSAKELMLFAWIVDPAKRFIVRDALNLEIYRKLKENDITIPMPQRDVWMRE